MFDRLRKSMALDAYRGRLGRELVRRHGRHRMYTVAEVRTAARALGLPLEPLSYAYALYCTEAEFDAQQRRVGLRRSYDALRAEIVPRFRLPGAARAGIRAADGDDYAAGIEASIDLGALFDGDGGGDGGGGD